MIPNIITGFRVFLVIPILILVAKGETTPNVFAVAAIFFFLAIATDMLDGQVARRLNMTSTFGAMFDLTADRLLMTPVLLMMASRHAFRGANFPTWLYLFIIIVADITIIIGIIMYSRVVKKDPSAQFPTPTLIVKATYPAQALVVFFTLLQKNMHFVTGLMWIAAILTVIAFISYMKKGSFVFKQGLQIVMEDAMNEFREDAPPGPQTKHSDPPEKKDV